VNRSWRSKSDSLSCFIANYSELTTGSESRASCKEWRCTELPKWRSVTILVTRTLHFSLFFLHCSLFVRLSRCFLLFRCASSPVTPSTSITPCIPPLSRLSDALVFSFARYAHFSLTCPSSFSFWCVQYTSSPLSLLSSHSV
jgi:hypothetical protein